MVSKWSGIEFYRDARVNEKHQRHIDLHNFIPRIVYIPFIEYISYIFTRYDICLIETWIFFEHINWLPSSWLIFHRFVFYLLSSIATISF